MDHLGAILATKRQAKGLSQRELSQEAGLSPSYVAKLERGEIEPSLQSFSRLAKALGLNEAEVSFCVRVAGLTTSP